MYNLIFNELEGPEFVEISTIIVFALSVSKFICFNFMYSVFCVTTFNNVI